MLLICTGASAQTVNTRFYNPACLASSAQLAMKNEALPYEKALEVAADNCFRLMESVADVQFREEYRRRQGGAEPSLETRKAYLAAERARYLLQVKEEMKGCTSAMTKESCLLAIASEFLEKLNAR